MKTFGNWHRHKWSGWVMFAKTPAGNLEQFRWCVRCYLVENRVLQTFSKVSSEQLVIAMDKSAHE